MEYPNSGSLFKNDRKEKSTHPDMKGSISIEEPGEYWLSAWTKDTKSGGKFLSLAVTLKDAKPAKSEDPLSSEGVQEVAADQLPF